MDSLLIKLVTAIINWIREEMRKAEEEAAAKREGRSPASLPGPKAPHTQLSENRIADLQQDAQRVRQDLEQLPTGGPVLVEALDANVINELSLAQEHLDEGRGRFAQDGLDIARERLRLLKSLAKSRQDPQRGSHLADAETLVDAFMTPFTKLAATEEFAFAKSKPVCVPAAPDEEAIWMGMLPGYPVIFVPQDFADNIYRWASLPHELGHLVFRKVDSFEDEVRDRLSLHAVGRLFIVNEGGQFDFEEPFSAWLEEIIADSFAMLMMGPAGLRGFVECFKSPDQPEYVQWSGAMGYTYAPHPPAHLRVLLAGELLTQVGYDVEAKALVEEWNDMHGELDELYLPALPEGAISIPTEVMFKVGAELINKLYTGSYKTFAGRELRSVHGLELTAGEWSQARSFVPTLVSGQAPRTTKPKAVLIAAIEAYAQNTEAGPRIARAVMRAVLGRDAGERRVVDQNYAINKHVEEPKATLQDVRAALVLREVLQPVSRRRRRL